MGLIGGAIKKNLDLLLPSSNHIYLLLIMCVFILIKMVIVKYSYNYIAPKIMKDKNVYELTYVDSLLLVILASCLF